MAAFTGTTSITINASPKEVWEALTAPAIVKQWLYGTEVVSDWKIGSPLIYKGQWEGQAYEDKGTILQIEPQKLLKATYLSSMSGKKDSPENYNILTYQLEPADGNKTKLTIVQENNPTQQAADQSAQNWTTMISAMKKLLEK
jgi:uncharacterized protein YndB with AHSA1/START domain